MTVKRTGILIAAAAGLMMGVGVSGALAEDEPVVIDLTQTACQFVESENGVDHEFTAERKADCLGINGRTAAERLTHAKTLTLKPGSYIFRVTNKNVPYELGFWLRGSGLVNRATLPSISGGGLTTGATHDYRVDLKAGEYVYSCPLNPTPDYKITVEG